MLALAEIEARDETRRMADLIDAVMAANIGASSPDAHRKVSAMVSQIRG